MSLMQTSYAEASALTAAGKVVKKVMGSTSAAVEIIPFGRVVCRNTTNRNKCQLPAADKATFSAAPSSGDVLSGNLVVVKVDSDNVQTITTYAIAPVTYATSAAATMAAFKAAIEAADPDTDVTATVGDTNTSITLSTTTDNVYYLTDIANNDGGTTVAYSMANLTPMGISEFVEKAPDSVNYTRYVPKDQVSFLTNGVMTVDATSTVTLDSTLYVQIIPSGTKERGMLRADSDSGRAVTLASLLASLKPDGNVTTSGLVNVKINQP